MEEDKKDISCMVPGDSWGTLKIGNKEYAVALTDIKRNVEEGRIRHTFVLTEII